MGKKKRYLQGRVYFVNNHVLTAYSKSNRRVVALNNDPNSMHVRRIMSLHDKSGKLRNLIPIERYPDIPKASGIEKRTFRTTRTRKPICERYLHKTNTRLNKWDRKKMYGK